ncbi:MAG: YraN family protein [Atopobiaceae bacterium]|nr:YraN family protein [Olsenella sp.]MBQ6491068.1 YraN family protein [Atopobiaceae bacterium]
MTDQLDDMYGGARGGDGRLLSSYTKREIGREGERIAVSYLENRGYEIIDRNWECDLGEVDIIARKRGQDPDNTEGGVALIEVKTRLDFGSDPDIMPELAVDREKRRRYRKLALFYFSTHFDLDYVRFDVIALNIVAERTARIRHLVGAFSWED